MQTVMFDSDIRDTMGRLWLRISAGWFDMNIRNAADLIFEPQTKRIHALNKDGIFVSMKYEKYALKDFKEWVATFNKNDISSSLERTGAIDGEGHVSTVSFEGFFKTPNVTVKANGNTLDVDLSWPGFHQASEMGSFIVDEEHHLAIQPEGRSTIFQLG